ncbi:uncharacterized protein METZ01_LOCUS394639, partial [marine metagenome]
MEAYWPQVARSLSFAIPNKKPPAYKSPAPVVSTTLSTRTGLISITSLLFTITEPSAAFVIA